LRIMGRLDLGEGQERYLDRIRNSFLLACAAGL
jgi:hypothetical protein